MNVKDLLENEDRIAKRNGLQLQQDLIERLPEDFDVMLTTLFLRASDYNYGKLAVKVKHPSYKGCINDGEVLIFPHGASNKLVFTPKGEYQRATTYDNPQQLDELATDLQKNVQKNEL